ncbi:MAG: FmdB family zinc ribbon protein [candidate division FCPU426 bacterium]
MARYVYSCTACGQRFEVDKPMTAASEPSACPQCQAPGRRVFTAPGITIKGSPIKFSGGEEVEGGSPEPESGCGSCANGACPWN